jgi:hypothetical protein
MIWMGVVAVVVIVVVFVAAPSRSDSTAVAPAPVRREAKPTAPVTTTKSVAPTKKHKEPPTPLRVGLVGVGSLIALVVGLILHSHYGPIAQVCNSGVGELGQALSSSAKQRCSTDSTLADAGLWMAIIGGFVLAIAVVTAVLGGLDRAKQTP